MTDIAPELWEKIHRQFNENMNNDERIQRFLSKMEKGTAVSEDAALYAMCLGECASNAFRTHITQKNLPNGILYWNIADRTIRPLLEEIHKLVNDAAVEVLTAEYKAAGIGIKPQRTDFPAERVKDLIDKIVSYTEGRDSNV